MIDEWAAILFLLQGVILGYFIGSLVEQKHTIKVLEEIIEKMKEIKDVI